MIRSAYGIFYDELLNGVGMPMRGASSALPQTVVRTLTGYTKINYANPLATVTNPFTPGQFALPASTFTIDANLLPPYTQDWNLTVDQTLGKQVLSVGYIGAKGTRLPRLVEAESCDLRTGCDLRKLPSASAVLRLHADHRHLHVGHRRLGGRKCKLDLPFGTSFNHAARPPDLSYTLAYTFSKDLDYTSSLHMSGPAPWMVLGELDIAQNNQDLNAEHGRSLFDSRNRFAGSLTYAIPFARTLTGVSRVLLDGWQFNVSLSPELQHSFYGLRLRKCLVAGSPSGSFRHVRRQAKCRRQPQQGGTSQDISMGVPFGIAAA